MKELAGHLNALCDALPFQTSWYLKDWASGQRADRLGDVPVPSASTRKISILLAALKAVHDGKLALDQKVTIEAKYQDNDSGIVFVEGRPYVICVMTSFLRNERDGEEAISKISLAAWRMFDRLSRASEYGRVVSPGNGAR